jgi:uncharacterized protein
MQTVIITGGTGLVGTALTKVLLQKGYRVIILSRNTVPAGAGNGPAYAQWDIAAGKIDAAALAEADFIVHLAGAGVADKRWTAKRKEEIVKSRTESSALLANVLATLPNKVQAVISASGIGWYGGDEKQARPFSETDPADTAFLGETCRLWEAGMDPVIALGKRVVKLRIGVVLSKAGGAYTEFAKPIRWGIAGILGNGKQVISWIHIDDLCRLIIFSMEEEKMQGVYNAVSPQPATNKALTIEMARKIKGSFYIPLYVPHFVLRLMLGEMSVEILKSATVSVAKTEAAGFRFLYPSIRAAVEALEAKPGISRQGE